jgi:hypothetical protein
MLADEILSRTKWGTAIKSPQLPKFQAVPRSPMPERIAAATRSSWRNNLHVRQECFMRHVIIPIVTALALGAATPAMAQDSGGQISMQIALDVATGLGIVTVSHTEFQGNQWEIEGRDRLGRWMEVYVDSRTGEVRHVNRGW